MESILWDRVGELADRAPRLSDLHHHKLHLLAASRMRARGEAVPVSLRRAEQFAAAVTLSAEPMMRRIRATTDAQIILMKGPVAAAYWPVPRLRPWSDLDLFVEDAHAMQSALLAAGFVELGPPTDYRNSHHLRPLGLHSMPLSIEVHRWPKWPNKETPPFDEVAETAAAMSSAQPDVLAPSAAHHAVLLAGHAWEHDPMGRIGSLADVATMMLEAGPEACEAVARAWGVSRLWSATARAIDSLLLARPTRSRPPIWLRHLHEARERTVFEGHVERLVAPVVAAPVTGTPLAATIALAKTVRPWPDESWSDKLRRTRTSLRNASVRESDHDDELSRRSAA